MSTEAEYLIYGFLFSTVISTAVMYILINCIAWKYYLKMVQKNAKPLTVPLGIAERALYTTGFLIGLPEIISIWLALKVAVRWSVWNHKNRRNTYNLFLIGNALSVLLSYLGASIAAQEFLTFHNNSR